MRETLKIAFFMQNGTVEDPKRVETIFAGRPFLLVRFLLDEQKKMNNYHRAPTLQVPVVTVLFLKAVPPLRIYLSTSISLGGLRRSFARSPVEKSLPPRHEDTKCFILNEYLSAFVAESFYNGGFRPHL